jgi:ribose transport system permease protein
MSVEIKTSSEASEEARLAATRRQARMGTLLSLTLLALLALMWLVLSFSTTSFWTYNNITNLLRQGSMIAILAMGETFVIITAGIDLSVGAVVGFGASSSPGC